MENKKHQMFTADRATGTFIEEVKSIHEGCTKISKYEEQDRMNGIYEEDFYCIVDEYHCIIL